jgi:hypothetical protein
MIDWRSPPVSPIASHYSRSRNHLPVNPFLNSRNPNSRRNPVCVWIYSSTAKPTKVF